MLESHLQPYLQPDYQQILFIMNNDKVDGTKELE